MRGTRAAQLARRLRSAQQQLADDRGFLRRELEAAELGIAEDLLVLRHAAAETRISPRPCDAAPSPSTTNFTVGSSSCMSGSRLLFWLHALTSAFSDSGYWSGVVICFSMSEPMMRASIADRRMFMREVY